MPDPVYKLVIVKAFGASELELEDRPSYSSKGQCEVDLEKILNNYRTHSTLPERGVRFGGACVEIESSGRRRVA